MKAIRLHEAIGIEGLSYEDAPDPVPAFGDVLVKVHACGITPTELEWPIWTDRAGHTRDSIIPAHEFSGVVAALGYGTTGFAVGDVDLEQPDWERSVGPVDLVYDTIGGEVQARSLACLQPGGALVTVIAPPAEVPPDIRVVSFIREPSRAQLLQLACLVDSGRLRPNIGAIYPLAEARSAFAAKPNRTATGKIILQP